VLHRDAGDLLPVRYDLWIRAVPPRAGEPPGQPHWRGTVALLSADASWSTRDPVWLHLADDAYALRLWLTGTGPLYSVVGIPPLVPDVTAG
jgi:hypothetical protein